LRRKGELAAHPPMRHTVRVVDNVDAVADYLVTREEVAYLQGRRQSLPQRRLAC
jgi:hypothetical protein